MNILEKKNKGITLISLTITVVILLLITGILVYNAKDSIYIKQYRNLSNDIQNLRDKVSAFYNEYGNIPAKTKYTTLSEEIKKVFNNEELQNIEEFYVLDLQEMEGISLNYGRDYEKVKNNPEEANNYKDLYIINKITHGIFYVQGISVNNGGENITYYTDYLEPTNEEVDYRYIDGVKIPEEFYYVGGNKQEGLVISDIEGDDLQNSKGGNQFVWIPVEDGNFKEDTNTLATDEEEFVKSVNNNKGFYIGRYETGIEGVTTLSANQINENSQNQTESGEIQNGTLVSKKDASPTNSLTEEQEIELAEKMYEENSANIKSRIYSKNAYEAVIEYIEKLGDKDYTNLESLLEIEKKENDDTGFRVVLYIPNLVQITNEQIILDQETNEQLSLNQDVNEQITLDQNVSEQSSALMKGTQCYINFDITPLDGYTAEVTPALPYKITQNGTYTFKITVTAPDGTKNIIVHNVNVKEYVEE